MRCWLGGVLTVVACGVANLQAAEITGEYLESRTCDVYTGPCFANGQIGLEGREALMAWKVDQGSWKGVDLKGLGVVLAIKATNTIGENPSFPTNPYPVRASIVVDENATPKQREALVAFVREAAPKLTTDIAAIETAPIVLKNDHVSGKGLLVAGDLARIETRKMAKGDCVCTNESIFYPPLTKIQNTQVAYALNMSFAGPGLNNTWSDVRGRSAFLGTFRK